MKAWKGLLALTVIAVVAGCGRSGGIDESKPLDQVAAEAAEMGQVELQKMVDKYEAVIADKTAEIDAMKEKLKEIPVTELMGDEARSMKEELSSIMDSLSALKEQMAVYAKELAAE